ncbi:hypothetical protein PENFLA_c017G05135 [Penicillium flavigenum]|uniref:Carboxylic ester hydrolase n=1 Tax=Penicillium flavigenum TaxID=254877 RepID=A0A1V6T2J5_9EURO|nr:hypothetical protein PENFLA_c017G05135 [Penicillium flavigenum]
MATLGASTTACSPAAIPPPDVFGAEILSLSATWVQNYTLNVPGSFNYNHGDVAVENDEFCNVTVTYTHPGHEDRITVETWLPRKWNRRLQATGGGGWSPGRFVLSQFFMSGAIGEGYVTTTTDAGLGNAGSPETWALTSPGNVNLYNLQNMGYVSLNDQAIIGKSLAKSFYGKAPDYSYWSGCSQGGRQGLMLAQRYPTAYDGIAASAPALSWVELTSSVFYPLLVSGWAGASSPPLACELNFLTNEAISECDPKDGVVDGVISDPSKCHFNALSAVNKTFYCDSTQKRMRLTRTAALVAYAAWSGPRAANGDFLWHGYNRGANINAFEYDQLFRRGVQEYRSLMNAGNPDLSEFKKAGGKLISYHGMADESIPTKSSEHYYRAVSEVFPDVQSFYRYFEAPGLGHCSGGSGGQPLTTFDALRRWVEEGKVPETLPVKYNTTDGIESSRILCPYPAKAVYQGGNISEATSFKCVSNETMNSLGEEMAGGTRPNLDAPLSQYVKATLE